VRACRPGLGAADGSWSSPRAVSGAAACHKEQPGPFQGAAAGAASAARRAQAHLAVEAAVGVALEVDVARRDGKALVELDHVVHTGLEREALHLRRGGRGGRGGRGIRAGGLARVARRITASPRPCGGFRRCKWPNAGRGALPKAAPIGGGGRRTSPIRDPPPFGSVCACRRHLEQAKTPPRIPGSSSDRPRGRSSQEFHGLWHAGRLLGLGARCCSPKRNSRIGATPLTFTTLPSSGRARGEEAVSLAGAMGGASLPMVSSGSA
jgi:hypothetical protein